MGSNDQNSYEVLDAELILEVLDAEFEASLLLSGIQFDEFCANLRDIEPY